MRKKLLEKGSDWMSENRFSAIEWLITGMHSRNTVFLLIVLTHSKKNISTAVKLETQ